MRKAPVLPHIQGGGGRGLEGRWEPALLIPEPGTDTPLLQPWGTGGGRGGANWPPIHLAPPICHRTPVETTPGSVTQCGPHPSCSSQSSGPLACSPSPSTLGPPPIRPHFPESRLARSFPVGKVMSVPCPPPPSNPVTVLSVGNCHFPRLSPLATMGAGCVLVV